MQGPDRSNGIRRLKSRADFVRAAGGRRWHGKGFSLQVAQRDVDRPPSRDASEHADSGPRVGFTLTKKVGCAVIRNRARRRLKEALRLMPDVPAKPGHDYVFIGRLPAMRLSFEELRLEMSRAISAVHDDNRPPSRRPGGTGPRNTRVKR